MNTNTSNVPQNFNSLLELVEYFTDEKKCLQYLENQRWGGEIACPHCGNMKAYRFSDDTRFKCAACREQFTAKVGTIFEGSKIPMKKWYIAIYLHTSHKKGISSHQLAKDIKVTQKSAWYMLHRIRFALGQGSFDAPLGNEGGEVEIDECYVGGKEKNKHKSKKTHTATEKKAAVLGMVERNGKLIVKHVDRATIKNVHPLIRQNVAKGANVMTDEAPLYKSLYKMNKRFKHETVNHSAGMYVYGNIHTNTIEGFWGLFQRGIIGIYHFVSPKHMQAYCDEFAYRYNTRKMGEGNRVSLTMTQVNKTITYNQLIGK